MDRKSSKEIISQLQPDKKELEEKIHFLLSEFEKKHKCYLFFLHNRKPDAGKRQRLIMLLDLKDMNLQS